MSADELTDNTDDAALGGRLRLLQPRRGHRFGHDGVLLAAAADGRAGDHVMDLGAGVGIAGLAVAARRPGVRVTLVERDPALAELAAENARRNGFADRVRTLCVDVTALAGEVPPSSAEAVIMNPPFNDPARSRASPQPSKARAHLGNSELLADWAAVAAQMLRPNAALTLIWRSDDRAAALDALRARFDDVRLLPIRPKPGAPPIRDLIRAVLDGADNLTILPELLLNGPDGQPTSEAEAVLRHAAPLLLAP